jgi:serine/threonine protein kinase
MTNPSLPDTDNPLSKILEAALEIESADQREEFIRRSCAGDETLLKEVRDLLRYAKIEQDLERLAEEDTSLVGKTIGKYKLRSQIGRGGMGTVYLGVRTKDFNHVAAIKIIRQGGLTKEDLRRFGKEMRIVATLDHPNIARLIDGGVTKTKLPYFVMDYVAGHPVDEYCDTNKLSIKERVELFKKIVSVVDYLHEKGIIHRDIKPSNIIITADGQPKIIDFGIAQVINSAARLETNDLTSLLQRAFSRDYASPEQVRGERVIEKSTDLYSLGALLYYLVTGHRPHRFSSTEINEITKVICEHEPTRPSKVIFQEESPSRELISADRDCKPAQLTKELSGDLEFIIMKALRKEPRRRYLTTRELLTDIDNYLQGKPVGARKGSWWYHFDKRASRFSEKIPPASIGWVAKLAIYVGLFLALLTALEFQQVRRWILISYTMVASNRVSAAHLTMSGDGYEQTKTAIAILSTHLQTEINAPKRGPNAWTMSQMAVALEGVNQVDKQSLQRFLTDRMSPDCNCWREGANNPKDLRVSGWVLLGMTKAGLSVDDAQIDFFLGNQQPEGWWTIYTDYPHGMGGVLDRRYASTYATAITVLALDSLLHTTQMAASRQEVIQNAVTRARIWLMNTRVPAAARWWDYPFNENKSVSLGISGLVLHVLHKNVGNTADLKAIDQLWLNSLPALTKEAKAREVSDVVIDPFNVRDPSNQFPFQWSVIATVDSYPNGDSMQRAKAIVWTDDFASSFGEMAKSVTGNTDWIASELLISLRFLQGQQVI